MPINIIDIRDFWKDMAESHLLLKHTNSNPHFAEFDFEQVNQILKSHKAFPLLALSTYDEAEMGYNYFSDTKGMNYEVFRGELLILDKVSDRADSYATRSKIYNDTLDIWRDIDARIDWRLQNYIQGVDCGPLNTIAKGFDRGRTSIRRVGAKSEGSNAYGWHIMYEVRMPYRPIYNPAKFKQ
jgi:hypothetical protein